MLASALAADALYTDSPHGLSADLKMVRTLIKADVLDLAESILENQSPVALPTDQWLAWERQLWSLYAHRSKWQELYERTSQISPSFPESIRNLALDQTVTALLELSRGKEARRMLVRRLVSMQETDDAIRQLRKHVIKSYLIDGKLEDASSSMSSYQRDYHSDDEDWLFLRAEILLKLGQPAEVVNLLAPSNVPKAKLLTLYARVLHQSITHAQAIERLQNILYPEQPGQLRSGIKEAEAAAVKAYLAQLAGQREFVESLEFYLTVKRAQGRSAAGPFPDFSLTDLLQAYEDYAFEIISDQAFLENDFSNILKHAEALSSDQATQIRALSAYLLRRVQGPSQRTRLCGLFVTSLLESKSIEIMAHLFATETPLGELSMSGRTGLSLSGAMIEQGRIQLAALVIDNMTESPDNIYFDDWLMSKARIYMASGRFASSFQLLRQWIVRRADLPSDQMDTIMAPIFELQRFRQHSYALKLMSLTRERITTSQQDRELSYWMAESYQATNQYLTAANYFLYSALLEDDGYDLWGISGRYHAAQSLESAHLFSDARKLYQSLLSRITDEARRAELKQKIRELRLRESGGFEVGEGLNEGEN